MDQNKFNEYFYILLRSQLSDTYHALHYINLFGPHFEEKTNAYSTSCLEELVKEGYITRTTKKAIMNTNGSVKVPGSSTIQFTNKILE